MAGVCSRPAWAHARGREGDLSKYVAQVQDDFDRRDQQLGEKPLQAAS